MQSSRAIRAQSSPSAAELQRCGHLLRIRAVMRLLPATGRSDQVDEMPKNRSRH